MFDPVSYAMGKASGGGGDITVESLSVTQNDTYTAPSGKAYSPVVVNVPNSYAAADEGKVVSNGELVAQTAHAEVTQNGTVDTTLNNSVSVNVPSGYTPTQIASRSDTEGIVGAIVLNNADNDIRGGAFENCKGITSVSAPNFTGASNSGYGFTYAFRRCTGLTHISFPKAVGLAGNMFESCTSLATVVMPKLLRIDGSAFTKCTSLTTFDVGGDGNGSVGSYAFNNTNLSLLVLRSSTMMTLANLNALTNSPFDSSGAGGTLYVPSSLISSYQGASNWSTILGYANNQIKSIESTHTDPNAPIDLTLYYADGTPIPTT